MEVFLWNESIWLTQKRMSELFGVQRPAITKHIKNIYAKRELERSSTVSILELVQEEGDRKVTTYVEYYNLNAIGIIGLSH